MKMKQKNKIYSILLTGILALLLGIIGFQQPALAEESVPINTPLVSIQDSNGDSVTMKEEDFNRLPEGALNGGVKEIKAQLALLQAVKPANFAMTRAVQNPYFGDWSNWQVDGVITRRSDNQMPQNIGGTRFRYTAGEIQEAVSMGTTYAYWDLSKVGFNTGEGSNPTNATWTATGDVSHIKIGPKKTDSTFSFPSIGPVVAEKADTWGYFIYPNVNRDRLFYVPYSTPNSIRYQSVFEYSSTASNGYDTNSNTITHVAVIAFYSPQIVKSVHKDIDTGADLDHQGDAGRGGYYGDALTHNKVAIPNYTYISRTVYDENGGSSSSTSPTWTGTLNNTKRGVVWFYRKNATNVSLTKSVDKPTAKVGETVSYSVKATNAGSMKLYKPVITDTLPEGMGKPTNIRIGNASLGYTDLNEGAGNANARGDYYTWNGTTRTLSVYAVQNDGIASGQSLDLTYKAGITSGFDGDKKINKAVLSAQNDGGVNPTAQATVTIAGDPNLSLTKTANKQTVKVGETISYTVAAENTGNARAQAPLLVDVLPVGMDKPTNVKINNSITVSEGAANATAQGHYFTWVASTRTLTIYSTKTTDPTTGKWTYSYDSKVLSGNDGAVLKNTATLSASNTTQKPTANATVTLVGDPLPEITKAVNNTIARVGETVKYTITVKNSGNAALIEPLVTDVLPVGMEKPSNVTFGGVTLPEGAANANSSGYFTWTSSTRTLKTYLSPTNGLLVSQTGIVTYTSKVLTGTDGESKINTATLSGKNDGGINPKASATFKILGDPKLELTKSVDQDSVKIGDSVTYTISGTNTGAVALENSLFVDTMPKELEKPTNITLIDKDGTKALLKEGEVNATSAGEYFTWDELSHTLTVHSKNVDPKANQVLKYTAKVVTGNNGDLLKNTVIWTGSNTNDQPTASAEIRIQGKMKIYIKQEVLNKNADVIIPTKGFVSVQNLDTKTPATIGDVYTMTIPSYEADSKQSFKAVFLNSEDAYLGYQIQDKIPEFYQYAGVQVSTVEQTHLSSNRSKEPIPILDFNQAKEYWVTIYIEPTKDNIPFYNWDYKVNDFGKLSNNL